jgi:hypothetical protein
MSGWQDRWNGSDADNKRVMKSERRQRRRRRRNQSTRRASEKRGSAGKPAYVQPVTATDGIPH